jgi:hypothetical protein
LVLSRIDLQGNPVAGGSFGDVYKGRLEGQIIAVKVLKVYEKSDRENLLKVMCHALSSSMSADQDVLAIFIRGCYVATTFSPKCTTVLRHLSSARGSTKSFLGQSLDGEWKFATVLGKSLV